MALKKFAFNILKKDKYARCGLIETHRGNIKTPTFMPVGTQATVKACTVDDIKKTCGFFDNFQCVSDFEVDFVSYATPFKVRNCTRRIFRGALSTDNLCLWII